MTFYCNNNNNNKKNANKIYRKNKKNNKFSKNFDFFLKKKGKEGPLKARNFAKIAKVTKIFIQQQQNTLTNIARITRITN